MESTFSGIELGKRGLFVHSKRLHTVGHNLSNMDTEGYSRQRVEVSAFQPLHRPGLSRANHAGQIGQGVESIRVRRVHDELLDKRIIHTSSSATYWKTRNDYILKLERQYNEPGESSVRHLVDKFWDSWEELSNFPAQQSSRHAVRQRGFALAEGIQLQARGLDEMRQMINEDIEIAVQEVNRYVHDIATLNQEIVRVEAEGDIPNDLLDKRDVLVQKLSTLVDISIDRRDPNEFSVHSGGYPLVQGGIARTMNLASNQHDLVGDTSGASKLIWEHNQSDVELFGGKMAALFELRDVDVQDAQSSLDQMTLSFMHLVNEIHRDGYGLNGNTGSDFFVEHPAVLNVLGNYDSNGDGTNVNSLIYRINGSNQLQSEELIGLEGTLSLPSSNGIVEINYFPEDSVSNVIERINQSSTELIARLNRNNVLELRATEAKQGNHYDFVIRSLEDSGQFLVGYAGILQNSGQEGAYNWEEESAVLGLSQNADYAVAPLQRPSHWIGINDAIAEDITNLAATFSPIPSTGAVGAGEAARAIANLRTDEIIVGKMARSFDDYFADVVASIAVRGEEAEIADTTRSLILKRLEESQEAISGVNMDEEVSQMIKFQHGYQAVARFISQYDELLDIIINRMAV